MVKYNNKYSDIYIKGSKERYIMKIDKNYKIHGKYIDTSIYKNKEDKRKNIDIKEDKGANIQISKSAKELVRQISKSEDANFSAKVEKIRQSILQGKYQVSSEKIADKILEALKLQESRDK